jgi:hypothetical protein
MARIEVVPGDVKEPIFIGDFYTYLRPNTPLLVNRPASQLYRLKALKQVMATYDVAVGVTLTEEERSNTPHDADLFAERTK